MLTCYCEPDEIFIPVLLGSTPLDGFHQVHEWLTSTSCSSLLLTGERGLGKTTAIKASTDRAR